MKIATYNILKGGSKRSHWATMIEDHNVDLLLVQESYSRKEHLPSMLFPTMGESVWDKAEPNQWGSGIFSKTGSLKQIHVPRFNGWVVGSEIRDASWQSNIETVFVFSIHAPAGNGGYAGQVNLLLDEIARISNGKEVILGGDFNLTVSHWPESERPSSKKNLAIQERLDKEFGLINCWQEANPNREPQQTLRWTRDRTTPYHCDGVFVPKYWKEQLQDCSILSGECWNLLSDHNPVVATFT